jgi:hypothetical protein
MDDGRGGGVSRTNPKYIVNRDYNYYQPQQQQHMTNNGDDKRVTLFYYTLLHLSSPRKNRSFIYIY